MSKKNTGTALRFVKVRDINQIPRYLLEQVKHIEYDIDRFYQWAPLLFNNPLNMFGAFIDKQEAVKGVLWCCYNPIGNEIVVHLLSVDKEYFGRGILSEADGIVNKLKKKMGAEKVSCVASRTSAFIKKFGFHLTGRVVLEK